MSLQTAMVDAADAIGECFRTAQPFRHVVLEAYFDPDFLAELSAEFPAFERGNTRNEAGHVGSKSVVEKIASLGPAYATLDNLIQSRDFLDTLGRMTGIQDLLYDAHYFGGGTHENRVGQELDPHVDFNRHPLTGWHRRLNLIVYLNPVWEAAWGGSLELHSDPRSPLNQIKLIEPLANRCVIFETTERSWHGFSRIVSPPEVQSRRSIALYFYTRDRPEAELADTHSTIYVDRPLPQHLCAGYQLNAHDMAQINHLMLRRDDHATRLYQEVIALTRELEQYKASLRRKPFAQAAHYARRVLSLLGRRA